MVLVSEEIRVLMEQSKIEKKLAELETDQELTLARWVVGDCGAEASGEGVGLMTEQVGTDIKKSSYKCPRCDDMFYHPKTIIEDYRQRAAEWEDIAKKAEAKLEMAVKALEIIYDRQSSDSWRDLERRYLNDSELAEEALEKLK